jgi:hypothetical protein
LFPNPKTGMLIKEKITHLYINNIQPNWRVKVKPIIKNIRIGKNQVHIITKFQFPIQLVITRTIHRSQGLSLDELAFDPTNLRNHGLSCTNFSRIQTKEGLYLLTPLDHQNFHIGQCVVEKMNRLKTLANWITFVLQFQNFYHSYVSVQAFNTKN